VYKKGKRYWSDFRTEQGERIRRPLVPLGKRKATTDWREATHLENALIEAVRKGHVDAKAGATHLFSACEAFLDAKKAVSDSERNIEFLTERLAIVKTHLGDMALKHITREVIEGFQAKRKVEGAGNRTINMDIGALRQVLKRYKHWRRLEDDVTMLSEQTDNPIGRVVSLDEQRRLGEAAKTNTEWEHVYCAAILAANTSMGGIEVKRLRRCNINLEKREVDIRKSKGGKAEAPRKRLLPLNASALEAAQTMLDRMEKLGHTDPQHFIWCANKHHKYNPTKPTTDWKSAWHSLTKAAGLKGLRFHDLRHTIITELLEDPDTPEQVVESITGHLSKRMLQHYSHIRMAAKRKALDRLDESRKAANVHQISAHRKEEATA
jgi:integrase